MATVQIDRDLLLQLVERVEVMIDLMEYERGAGRSFEQLRAAGDEDVVLVDRVRAEMENAMRQD